MKPPEVDSAANCDRDGINRDNDSDALDYQSSELGIIVKVAEVDGRVTLHCQLSCAVTLNVSKKSKCSNSAVKIYQSSPG